MKKFILPVLITLWAILFYLIGIYNSNADMMMNSITSPAYHFMPQNLYHNTIHGNTSKKYTINKTCSKRVNRIEVYKSKKRMILVDDTDCIVKEYVVRTGLNKGAKHCAGDKKTPEGTYYIKDKRNSKYVKFLELNYPNANDIQNAKELGCNPGNAIGIHYYNEEYTNDPSTLEGSLGCITVWNKDEIREIYNNVKIGTTVIIKE